LALNSTVHPATRFFGPFLGGILMAQVRIATDSPLLGAATLFYITAAGYVLNAAFLYRIRMPAVEARRQKTSVLADMRQGVKLVWNTPVFAALIAMTYCGQFFGWSFQSLFPIFAKDVFHGGEFELGLMYSTLGAGSLLGAMASSNLSGVKSRGRLIAGGFIVQASVLGFVALAPSLEVALVVLLLVGLSQAVFNVTSQSTLQYLVPNQYRGRVMGIWGMTHTTVAPLGQLQMGSVAAAFSAPGAVVIGAVAMLAFAVLFVLPNRNIRELRLDVTQPREPAEGGEPRGAYAARH
jgi:predicted MFS family arabinose efflux permease